MNKKLSLLLLLSITIISLSAISATELSDNNTHTESLTQTQHTQVEANDQDDILKEDNTKTQKTINKNKQDNAKNKEAINISINNTITRSNSTDKTPLTISGNTYLNLSNNLSEILKNLELNTKIDYGNKNILDISKDDLSNIKNITIGNYTNIKDSIIGNYTNIKNSTLNNLTNIIDEIDNITLGRNATKVTVDPVKGVIGENITFIAHVTDTKGKAVTGGNLVFKVNGKTLKTNGRFDTIAFPWKFKVNNGKVTATIKADSYLRNAKNLTATYSGSFQYKSATSKVVTAQIKKRNAKLTVTATPKKQKQYDIITLTAKIQDKTPNYKNKTAINENTKVLFKINGKTIKNLLGRNVLVNIVNGKASYNYTVPRGMGGITKEGKIRNYNVEAVLVSDSFYPDTRAKTTFNVKRSPVTLNIVKTYVTSSNKLSVLATIKDYKNRYVLGNSTIALKINGKTYVNPSTNKKQTFKVSRGIVLLLLQQVSKDIKIKKVMLVTGARQAYLGARNETTDITKSSLKLNLSFL
ncbi:Ig-like domain-containing protein [Methanosphaera sp. ISO3-F5]|uniref:Ig-like domain-containing protein n=1 Tax=Methanosphaera sp. ISO3-F5 TaxID=1452353 RepID=UPI002B25C7A8|nr:Ig-like domain-containing protein [Methanosphaera sp. ISO3-F5]WQH64566.1 Ig-like domain-containing protein [Methanosphaera sp. ISO3-F5]